MNNSTKNWLKKHSSVTTPGYKRPLFNHIPTTELVAIVTQWIENCTEILCEEKPLLEFLQDGTVLCKVIQIIQPGLIRRTNRIKNPFAWRENILFFLEACQKLGLRDCDLFTPEELYEDNKRAFTQSKRYSQETRLRKVCESLYCLALKTSDLHKFCGPSSSNLLQKYALLKHQATRSKVAKQYSSTQHLCSELSNSAPTKPAPAVKKARSVVSLIINNNTLSQSFLGDNKTALFCDSENPVIPDSLTGIPHETFSVQELGLLTPTSCSPPITCTNSWALDFNSPVSEGSTVTHEDLLLSPVCGSKLSSQSHLGDKFVPVSSITHSQPTHSQPTLPDNEHFLNNPFSPHHHLSNIPAHQHIDHTGIISQTRSQETLNLLYYNPQQGDVAFHCSLTQKSEDNCPHRCSEQSTFSQHLAPINSDISSTGTGEHSPVSSLPHLANMSAAVASIQSGSVPMDIPINESKSSVPHHCLDVSEADSSSVQEVTSKFSVETIEREVVVLLFPDEEMLGLNLMETSAGVLSVKAIGPGSAASRADLQSGDELLSVGNVPLVHTSLNKALGILQEAMLAGKFVLRIRRAEKKSQHVPRYKSLRPPDLLDMSRVTSDALPHSLNATTVHVDPIDIPDFIDSSVVEVLSSPDDPSECPQRGNDLKDKQKDCNSGKSLSKNSRPLSAPTKSRSSTVVSTGKSHTLPSKSSSVSRFGKVQPAEKKKRTASIHNNVQILLKYAQTRQTTQSNGSLRRASQSPTQLGKLFNLSDDQLADGSVSPDAHSHHSNTSLIVASSNSTPLNLRHISMDETRIASVMQMDSIWRQVESGDDSFNYESQPSTAILDQCCFNTSNKDASEPALTSSKQEIDGNAPNSIDAPCMESELQSRISQLPLFTTTIPLATSSPQRASPTTASKPTAIELECSTEPAAALHNISLSSIDSTDAKEKPASFSTKDIDSLLITLKSYGTPEESIEDLKVLEQMLKSSTFKKAKKIHDMMHQLLLREEIKPICRRVLPSMLLVRQSLHIIPEQDESIKELRNLLRLPHIQALVFCHDKVSIRDLYVPDSHFHKAAQDPDDKILSESLYHFDIAVNPSHQSIPFSRDVPSGRKEGAVIVFVERTNRPLGITLYTQEESVFIGKLISGCDAEASDVLREGDELLEVNGMPIWEKTTEHIITLMSPGRVEEGDILVLTIIPIHDNVVDIDYETKYIRAHFNYNGRLDEEIPCKALGLSFQKGDILEISNQDDPNWWQARKVFDDGAESLPGLIPSRHLQQQREALIRSYPFNFPGSKPKKGIGSIFSKRKKKKVFYQNTSTSSSVGVGDEVPTYEEVLRLDPGQSPNRPIILIGAPRVGKRALIRELVHSNPSRFLTVVSHTSRNPRPGEVEGKDYFFVTKEEFESDMHRDRFLEYGEYKGAYYGTSFISIKRIMEASKVPVLDVHPQALKKLRYSGLQPYVIFIASPKLERLQFTRQTVSDRGKKNWSGAFGRYPSNEESMYTEFELKQVLEESLLIENQYGHYFDWIIINDNFQVASDMLKEVVRRVGEEPQWIPALWKYDRY